MLSPEKCQFTDDCTEREVCRRSGYCGCAFADGFANGPACDKFTSRTAMAIVVSSLLLMISTFALVFTLATLLKVVRVHRRGYFVSCSIFSLLAAFTGVASHLQSVMHLATAGGFWKHNPTVPENYQHLTAFLLSTLTVCATLNLGLMWIEFVHTTRCAEHVHSNLHKTAIWLYAILALWVAAGAALLALSLRVDQIYFKVWRLASVPFLVVCTAIYIAGGRSMHGVFLRAEQRCTQHASSILTQSPAVAAQELQKAHRMRTRARMTRRSYEIFAFFGLIFVLSSIMKSALEILEISQATVWVLYLVQRCSVYGAVCNICMWLYSCVSMEESCRESAVEAVLVSFTNASFGLAASPVEQKAHTYSDQATVIGQNSSLHTPQSVRAAPSTTPGPSRQSAQPAELASRPSPPAEPSPSLPLRARNPARCRADDHGAGGASTSQTRVDEQAAIAPHENSSNGSSPEDVRLSISTSAQAESSAWQERLRRELQADEYSA